MFKVKYKVNDKFCNYKHTFYTEWEAQQKARGLCNIMQTEVIVVESSTNLVLAHYVP